MATTTLRCSPVLLFTLSVIAQQPVQVDWSSQTYGPDGPWNALRIDVGNLTNPTQAIDLYPGGFLNSQLIASTACDNANGATCYAQQAGLYDWNDSKSVVNINVQSPETLSETTPVFYQTPLRANGTTSIHLDTMYLNNDFNPLTNMTIFALDEVINILPNGTGYPATIGTFGLGGPPIDHRTLTLKPGARDNPATQMYADKIIASASFGLHIGSVEPSIPGSLWYGGYDKSRVVGPVNSQQYLFSKQAVTLAGVVVTAIDLIDITLDVAVGGSPFSPASQSGLLVPDDGSESISLRPGGETPYLHLPKATCDALAKQLPVTYHPDFNVYLWNTDDPQYKRIVTSPSYMGLVFRSNNLNNLTINLPFMLLNLTLSPPLMAEPTPYFPCYPTATSAYILGRSFLQAAFFGVNWNADNPPGNWWLAQAPGPNTDSNPTPTTIENTQEDISGFENADWAKTWDGYWTPLPMSSSSSSSNSSGLSTGAQAGIGVGVAVAALLALAAILFFLYRRRQQKKKEAQRADSDTECVISGALSEPKPDPGISSDSETSTSVNPTAAASSPTNASAPNTTEIGSAADVERFELDSAGPARHEIADPSGEGDARKEIGGSERLEMDGGMKPEMDGAGPVVGSALNPAETGAGRENERFEMPTSVNMTPMQTPVEDRKYVTVQAVKDAIIKRQDEEIGLADVVHETDVQDDDVQRAATPISEAEKRRLWAKYNGAS